MSTRRIPPLPILAALLLVASSIPAQGAPSLTRDGPGEGLCPKEAAALRAQGPLPLEKGFARRCRHLSAGPILLALPPTVRIGVGFPGTSYAVIASTATLLVRTPEGQVLYRGISRVVARTDVRRLADDDTPLPRVAPASEEERQNRVALLREARIAERVSFRAVARVPFELSVLKSADDDLGTVVYQAQKVRPLRLEAVEDGLLSFNGKVYRGTFELAEDEGRIVVINTVPTDRYLVSVVGSEVPADWHVEALAAQAVAARTYLLKHLGSQGSFDLLGDERDQAYKGLEGEWPSTERAVARTAGLVATYRGQVVDAFYSANAGGITENSEDVWLTPLPYLRSVPSPGDTVALRSSWGKTSYEWIREYTEPKLRRQLEERLGVTLGRVVGIDVVERSAAGGVLRARIRGTTRALDVFKDSTRWYFGLRSQLFSVSFHDANEREVVQLGDGERERDAARRIGELDDLGADRIGTFIAAIAGASDGAIVVTGLRTAGYLYSLPARIAFTGKGFGHRVGMSQWGMQGMALAGSAYDEILKHYYRGIELTKVAGP